ncbi:MAG: hypothetical protein P8Y15_09470 [Gemmatimonadales bacterium]
MLGKTTKKTASRPRTSDTAATELIDARIDELGDWRGETLGRVRTLIKEAEPGVDEDVKWSKPSN